MTSVRFQFHAETDELLVLAAAWAREHGLRVAVERFYPDHTISEVAIEDLAAGAGRVSRVDRIGLGRGELRVEGTHGNRTAVWSEGTLYIAVAWPTERGLPESFIGGTTDDPMQLAVWQRILRGFKVGMHKGATTRGWTGLTGTAPDHRHTVGAHQLAASGVRMADIGGATAYLFDDCPACGT